MGIAVFWITAQRDAYHDVPVAREACANASRRRMLNG